jgi:hypothetical protein
VRGNANRTGDFLAPAGVAQEMLSKFLSRHESVFCQSIRSLTRCSQPGRPDGGHLRQQGRSALRADHCVVVDLQTAHTLVRGNRS